MGLYLQVRRKVGTTTTADSGVRRILPRVLARPQHSLPNLEGSHEEMESTRVSAEVAELAGLSDLSSIPQLTRAIEQDMALTPAEAYLVSLLGTGFDLARVLDMSPLPHDETFQLLARFVTRGVLRFERR